MSYQQEVSAFDKKFIGAKFIALDEASQRNPWLAVENDLKTRTDTGRIKISDNWGEIAQWMGVEPRTLQNTIDGYNAGCDKKSDFFAKDAKFLTPLVKPPYYAVKTVLNLIVTHGVIKTNERMEILDKQNKPLPGLYVAGDDIGGTDENIYGGLGRPFLWLHTYFRLYCRLQRRSLYKEQRLAVIKSIRFHTSRPSALHD